MPADQGLTPSETARVFFALWPDAALRQRLHAASGALHALRGGRRTRPETVHLTLLFIGAVERGRLPELRAAAEAVRVPAFEVAFDRAECWRRNRIAFLGASQPPQGLFDLVADLERNVAVTGIAFDRRPYTPHITLLRNADCRKGIPDVSLHTRTGKATTTSGERSNDPALAPILWPARDFVLVESRLDSAGASYLELGRWPLLQEDVTR